MDKLDKVVLYFTQSVYLAGLLHIVSNITKDLKDSLFWYDQWLDKLRHVCRLLSRRYNRERMVETCFKEGPARLLNHDFDSFNHEVYEGRWGSVLQALSSLLPLERSLRYGWSKRGYVGQSTEKPSKSRDDEKACCISTADEAIQCDLFWAYCHMIDAVGEVLAEVQRFAESCPCHYVQARPEGVARHSRHDRGTDMMRRIGQRLCPLRSCQAPACAAGFIDTLLGRLLSRSSHFLLFHSCMTPLSISDRSTVLQDFAAARSYLEASFLVKCSHWRQLPWILCGLGHWDHQKGRECGKHALRLYGSFGSEHWLAFAMCAPGTMGREQLTAFVNGRSLDSLPYLKVMVARLAFAPVSERWVDGVACCD